MSEKQVFWVLAADQLPNVQTRGWFGPVNVMKTVACGCTCRNPVCFCLDCLPRPKSMHDYPAAPKLKFHFCSYHGAVTEVAELPELKASGVPWEELLDFILILRCNVHMIGDGTKTSALFYLGSKGVLSSLHPHLGMRKLKKRPKRRVSWHLDTIVSIFLLCSDSLVRSQLYGVGHWNPAGLSRYPSYCQRGTDHVFLYFWLRFMEVDARAARVVAGSEVSQSSYAAVTANLLFLLGARELS